MKALFFVAGACASTGYTQAMPWLYAVSAAIVIVSIVNELEKQGYL